VFGAYNQGDPATLRQYGGTGLGLAVSAQLVDLMGGNIKLKSQPGHGSRFRFTACFMLQQDQKRHHQKIEQPELDGLNALVVDDNDSSRKIIGEMLESFRINVVQAFGPQLAREMLQKSQAENIVYDLILIDSDMPEADGFSLAQWIKSQQISDADIIMLLTFPHLKRKPELEELGITASLVKPLGASELEGVLINTLGIDKARAKVAVEAPQRPIQIPARSLNILVAEDTPFNQKFIRRLLDRWNHQITLVGNGQQALDALKKDTFDLILMDVQMPQLDGLEATRAIRSAEKASGKHLPIIAMTAHAIKGDRERCLEAGMDDYVSKTIDAEKWFCAIETLSQALETPGSPDDEFAKIDKELLLQAFDGDWSFLREVVEVFLSDYHRLMDDLRRAFEEKDSDTLMRAAHSLKGMLKNFQAEPAAEIAYRLEKMGKAENFDGIPAVIEELAGQIAEVDKTLRGILKQQSG
jgi:CheY-like chemotaxis protein